ncbi:MAG: O-antigen ligase family protein [Candidatus Omnitrophota bacterium]
MNIKVISLCDKTVAFSLYLLIFSLPFSKAGISIFFVLGAAAWLGKRIAGFRTDGFKGIVPLTSLNKAFAVFLVLNIISVIFSIDVGESLSAFFSKTLKFLVIFLMMIETINSEQRVKKVLWALFFSGVILGADSVYQLVNGVDFLKGYDYENRLRASFSSGNGLAGWLIVVLSVFLGWLKRPEEKRSVKAVLGLMTLFLFFCLVMTYSRGGWLGFFISFLVAAAYILVKASWKQRLSYFIAAFSLVLLFVLLPQSTKVQINEISKFKFIYNDTLTARIKSIFDIHSDSTPLRLKLWQESLNIIKDHPLTGCGLNTYSIIAKKYKSFEGGGVYPHNSFLQMTAEIGIPGVLAFLWILFSFFRTSLMYLKQYEDYLLMGAVSASLGFLIQAFFDTHFFSLQMVVLFWFMFGLATALVKTRSRESNAFENKGHADNHRAGIIKLEETQKLA